MFWFANSLITFKRAVGMFLVAVLSVGYSLGLSVDFQGAYYDKSSLVTYSFYEPTKKAGRNEFIGKNPTYDIRLARNEYEGCLIAIRSKYNSNHRKYNVEFSEFKNENGDALRTDVYLEKYVDCFSDKDYGVFPEILVPVKVGEPSEFILRYANNWPFYIRVRADNNTPAGKYSARVRVTQADSGKLEFIADVTATVLDFSLPETPSCETAFGLSSGCINKLYHLDGGSDEAGRMYKIYYDYLLDRKISCYDMPYDILSDEADAYMSDPRVVSFCVPYCPGDDALLQRYYAKVQSNPEWAKKAYFYPIDEPSSAEDYARYGEITDRLERLCPGYHMVTPFGGVEIDVDGEKKYTLELQKGSDIVCPVSNTYDSSLFREQIEKRRADGSKIWWYVCCGPGENYCNFFTNLEGVKSRLLFWQQKSLDVNGLLYWCSNYWQDVVSPWTDQLTTPWTGNTAFGDGSILYNGPEGPTQSLRLELIADGIEDFEYLTMAERLFGPEYVDAKLAEVTRTLTDYTLDDALLARVRAEIGSDIEKKLHES